MSHHAHPHLHIALPPIIESLKQKLSQTIVSLQSDEILQQMRNDKSLYEYKLTHIKQIIDEGFGFEKQLGEMLEKNQVLREQVLLLEERIGIKDREFNQAIDMIEDSAKRHTQIKQQQIANLTQTIRQLNQKLSQSSQQLQTQTHKTTILSQTLHSHQSQIHHLQKQLNTHKQQQIKLTQQNKKLMQLNKKYKIGYKQSQVDHQKLISSIKNQYQKEIIGYENVVKKMQNDMMVIRNQWEKKCKDTERNVREFYEGEMLKLQEKKTRQLIQHIQTMKQGKPIIIKQDQEILTSRIESVRRNYESQLTKLHQQHQQLTQRYQSLQNSDIPKIKQIQSLSEMLKTMRSEFEEEKQNWGNQKERSKRQIEKLKAVVLEFERNWKNGLVSLEEKQGEIVKLGDQVRFLEKKNQISNRAINEVKATLESKEDQLQKLKNKCNTLQDALRKAKKNIENLQQQLQQKNKQITHLTKQLTSQTQQTAHYQSHLSNLKQSQKSQKTKHQNLLNKTQQLLLQLTQIKKQQLLLKQDMKHYVQINGKKNHNQYAKMQEQIRMYCENVQKMSKNKIGMIIDELEEAKEVEERQFQRVVEERDKMRRDMTDMEVEYARKYKQQQQQNKAMLKYQADQAKQVLQDQLHKQQSKYSALEQQPLTNQQHYHRTLQKTKQQLKHSISIFTKKWKQQILHLQEQNKNKQNDLQRIVQKIQTVIKESQDMKYNYENEREQLKKMKKKYEILKCQKEDNVGELIRRLQIQSKHKISLEKELRSIRSQLNMKDKSQYQNTNRYVETQNTGHKNMSTDRNKEINEIRELIAKTYQAVGQKPQKDYKIDRKRSPY